ncbi:MAG: transposase, partial [Euryarchaeota archaeon]|nr:transposase [Euryarchaeota archaeon]
THCEGLIKAFTDDYTIYIGLEEHTQVKEHHVINHSEKEYADGENHVNNCENRHSLLRQYLRIFRGVSKKKFNIYVKFFQFTFNKRVNWLEKALQVTLNDSTITGG